MNVAVDLPLRVATGPAWLAAVLAQPLALLDDHAHLERAAAANALSLLARIPDDVPVERWVSRLTGVARDEVEHLALVHRTLVDRGGSLSRGHANDYARRLRALVRSGEGPRDLADRLLVSALIEARSCERFLMLASADHDLAGLYADLAASEAGHHRLFVGLAELVLGEGPTQARWSELLDAEAVIAAEQPIGPRMHAGWRNTPAARGVG